MSTSFTTRAAAHYRRATTTKASRREAFTESDLEARAVVEPTYTDLQSRGAQPAQRLSLVTKPRAERARRLKRAQLGKNFPMNRHPLAGLVLAVILTACGGDDPDDADGHKAIPPDPSASSAR